MATVLLVDPDVALREMFRSALEADGHVVLATAAAGDARDQVREGGVDLMCIDFAIPGGVEAFLRAVHVPDLPPFVLLSDVAEAPELSARLGASAFLPKPCSAADLVTTVKKLLSVERSSPVVTIDDLPTRPVERP